GLSIVAGDHVQRSIGAASKYAAASVIYPDPARTPGGFIEEIQAIVRRLGITTIVPATDLTTMLLASQPAFREMARLACPDAKSYEALTDKASLVKLAGELGVLVPETRIAHTRLEIESAVRDLGYPAVLKPARSRFLADGRVTSTSVRVVQSSDHLAEAIDGLEGLDRIL